MSDQPEALRLADVVEQKEYPPRRAIAAELRRLHEVNQELLEALKEIEWSNNEQWRTDRARAAIAKAEGETK